MSDKCLVVAAHPSLPSLDLLSSTHLSLAFAYSLSRRQVCFTSLSYNSNYRLRYHDLLCCCAYLGYSYTPRHPLYTKNQRRWSSRLYPLCLAAYNIYPPVKTSHDLSRCILLLSSLFLPPALPSWSPLMPVPSLRLPPRRILSPSLAVPIPFPTALRARHPLLSLLQPQ